MDETTRRAPPKNEIIPEKLGIQIRSNLYNMSGILTEQNRKTRQLEDKIDGIIVDQDIDSTQLSLIRTSINSKVAWDWIRDIITIILLLVVVGLIVWRGLRVEALMSQCGMG